MSIETSSNKFIFATTALIGLLAISVSLSTLSFVFANEATQTKKAELKKKPSSQTTLIHSSFQPALALDESDLEIKKEKVSDELSKVKRIKLPERQNKNKQEDYFRTIPILGFHDIVDENNPQENPPNRRRFDIDYPVSKLEKFLEYLVKNDFWFLTSNEFYDYFVTESKPVPTEMLSRKPILLTFDDGYQGMHKNLLPLLERINKKYGLKVSVTLFINPSLMKIVDGDLYYLSCEEIQEGVQKGYFDVQSHGLTHLKLTELPPKEVSLEMAQSKSILKQCLKNQNKKEIARFIAYPFGAIDQRVEHYASRHFMAGFIYNNKLFRTDLRNNKYRISRIVISSNRSVEDLIKIVNGQSGN